jgi:cilia- and flagella-associated protein 65
LQAVGNTFLHQNPELSPKAQLSHSRLTFPPCKPGEQSHQTLLISNHGDTTIHFTTQGLAPSGVFAVKPATGTIVPKGHQLVRPPPIGFVAVIFSAAR